MPREEKKRKREKDDTEKESKRHKKSSSSSSSSRDKHSEDRHKKKSSRHSSSSSSSRHSSRHSSSSKEKKKSKHKNRTKEKISSNGSSNSSRKENSSKHNGTSSVESKQTTNSSLVKDTVVSANASANFASTAEERKKQREKEQAELELEMQKRRERVEKWRKMQLLQKQEEEKEKEEQEQEQDQDENVQSKKWSLEDDDDDDEQNNDIMEDAEDVATTAQEEADEIDPLDAFMVSIESEVAKKNKEHQEALAKSNAKGSSSKRRSKRGQIDYQDKAIEEIIESSDDDFEEDSDDEPEWRKKAKKRELQKVDHSKVSYPKFTKKFYLESPEISKLTEEEVKQLMIEYDDIKVRGKKCPRPIKFFHQAGLSDKILDKCKKYHYVKPTPIQAQAIPAIMSGRNVIGIAKTGSGKTLAFLLPMLRHILDQQPSQPGEGPIGLVMAPTRELAMQIHAEYKKFTKSLNLRSVCVYGGAGVAHQIGDLKRGAEIVVCTPGRMIDILCTNNGRITNLSRVTFLVLDEADRMFDMGFEPQITRIIENIRPDRQTVMFSATFPRTVEQAARKILRRPIEITVGGRSSVCSEVTQYIEVRDEDTKLKRLLALLAEWYDMGNILIFVHRQESCDTLFKKLIDAKFPCLTLHGGMDQSDRDSTIVDFKKKVTTVLVATSIAARGLDVPDLVLVVNYDCPNHYEDYVHRVGRTGRAGRKGWAYTFITPEEEQYAPDLVHALTNSKVEIPEKLKELAAAYKSKKQAGHDVKVRGSGFGGKGFKFDEAEEAQFAHAKKLQKAAWGEPDSSDDDDDDLSATTSSTAQSSDLSKDAPSKAAEDLAPTVYSRVLELLPDNLTTSDPLFLQAMKKIRTELRDVKKLTPALEAKVKAIFLNIKLSVEIEKPADQLVEAELEINDYPQQARWKVTHKDALAPITEWTGCAITTRGSFVPSGKKPAPGERKLYLFIEGPTEVAVKKAKEEIKGMLNEAALHFHPEKEGRYKVL